MNHLATVLVLLLICIPFPSWCFVVDGFTDGMTTAEVENVVKGLNLDKVKKVDNRIYSAEDTEREYYFQFYKGSLKKVQKNIKPRIYNYIMTFNMLSRAYGNPTYCFPSHTTNIDNAIIARSVVIEWDFGKETITLTLDINNNMREWLYVNYQLKKLFE
jgi:hypothetical protein